MAVTDHSRPEDARAQSLVVKLQPFREAKAMRQKLTGRIGSEDLGGLLAAIHAGEAFLELKGAIDDARAEKKAFDPRERRDLHGRWTNDAGSNLHTFQVDLNTSLQLARLIPEGVLKVAESGIDSSADIARLRDAGFEACLIGESLMRAQRPGDALRALLGNPASLSI